MFERALKGAIVVVALAAVAALPNSARAAGPATRPLPPTTQGGRDPQAILQDLQKVAGEFQGILGSVDIFSDVAKRKEIAPKALPLFKRALALTDELAVYKPSAKTDRYSLVAIMALLGDVDAVAQLDQAARSDNASVALAGKGMQLMLRWWQAGKDAAAQAKVMTDVETLAKANADQDFMVQLVGSMVQRAADASIRQRAADVVTKTLTSPRAKGLAEEIEAEIKLAALEGKPLTIAGVQVDGQQFSTASWKGKVVLVDFWASWCAPCREELPRVKKAYRDFHAKGLEIVGVSCDENDATLKAFIEKDGDIPWPQLFDKAKPGWHELAKQFGVQGIPTMFLIDKKGVVRSIDAREDFEELIPKLLDEKE
jgi:thiol-disulfide isomerase/thioredoxin